MHRTLAAMAGLACLACTVALATAPAAAAPAAASAPAGRAATPAGRSLGAAAQVLQSPASRRVVDRFNEGATHSPQVERALAAGVAQAPRSRASGSQAPASQAAGPAATPSPSSVPGAAATVQGVDVASFQHADGAIDWTDVAAAGYSFAFIKATEGSYYVNPYYAADSAAAQAAGLVVAPYAFGIPNYSGGAYQADYALNNSGYAPDGRQLPLILDIEPDPYAGTGSGDDGTSGQCYGLTTAQTMAWIGAFTAEAERRTGLAPVIYTDQGYWVTCTGDSASFDADPLWIASYATSPSIPAAWSNWAYWQYTSSAAVPGITGAATDTDWLNSGAVELARPATQSGQTSTTASLTLHALNGTSAAVSYTASGLPAGLTLNSSTGVISGKLPAKAATFPVTVTATASGAPAVTQSFSWDVHAKASFGRLASQAGSVAAPVRLQVSATDGLAGCTLTYRASGLPRGLSVSSCGLISGWLTESGKYTVKISATDSSGAALASRSFTWTVSRASGAGPDGQIRLQRDGKCLEARTGTDVAITTCSTWSKERWTFAADGTVRSGGDCLAAVVAKSGKDTLRLAGCSSSAQRWQLGAGGSLTDLSTGTCLSDTGTANGTRAYAPACTGSTSQQWTLPAGPLTAGIPGYCASSLRGVTLRRCVSSAQQDWTIAPDGAVSNGGKCLSLAGGKTSQGTKFSLVTCSSSASQRWQLAGGPFGSQLVSPVAGLCLADPGDRASAGTPLELEPCVTGDQGVTWRVS